ncbi:nucleoside diphosphate kinase regulator [Massilia sp. CF038]|uniref:nucleoside diphosphate kinase regulator n=1 Tax=Massilia sp. CF038 TaxID=1881045 RepID=UPI00091B663C|nr:nucleoside diphosphate kinase regulator [Massilia sp. CF038]SHH71855.1 GreA/GreB family elongation factor [Massilia sp. CF038]
MKPTITVSSLDAERLETLIANLPPEESAHHDGLLEEIARAKVVEPQDMPPGVVTMNSTVRFQIDEPAEQFCLTLSYPKDMPQIDDGISVLTPIGTALLGLSVGDSIDWPRRDGHLVKVRLLEVLFQPERAGQYFR